jgi:DNA-binding MarR family transcriptional regulator
MTKTKAVAAIGRSPQDQPSQANDAGAARGAPVPWEMIYLMARLFYGMRNRCEEALKPFGLTSMQFTILSTLSTVPGLSSAELSRRFNVTPQTMGEMIVNLEKRSLVAREQDPQNRRALKLALTGEGLALLRQGEEAMLEVEADMFGAMPPREREVLRSALLSLHERMSPPAEPAG